MYRKTKALYVIAVLLSISFRSFAESKEYFSYDCLARLTDKTTGEKFVALTFDDGPSKSITPQIRDVLNEKGTKATFFVLGRNVKNYPEIVLSLKNSGHEIANHSYSHPNLRERSESSVEDELRKTNDELEELQIDPKWFRPPYGSFDSTVKEVAFENDMHSILWSLDPKDWKSPSAETLKQRILKDVDPGEIILLHDIHKSTLRALPGIIDALKARGYTFVTLSEWYDKLQSITPSYQPLCSK